MIRRYAVRGVAAGAIAGLCYGLFVAGVIDPFVAHLETVAHAGEAATHAGEPAGRTHAGEAAGHSHGGEAAGHSHGGEVAGHSHGAGGADHHGHGHGHEAAGVAGTATAAATSVLGGLLWGILLGGSFGVAYYLLEPAVPGTDATRPYVLAGAGFLTVSVGPWLVLPPAAPGVDHALGADPRLAIYAGGMVGGALLAALSVGVYHRVRPRGAVTATGAAGAVILAAVVLVPIATPTLTTAGAAPTDLLAAFRGTVLAGQAALWALVAGSFCGLGRWLGGVPAPDQTADAAASPEL